MIPPRSQRWPRTPTSASSSRCSRRCKIVRAALDPETALIGFCGAPWTVATYMVAGQGTPDQAPARMMAYRHPEAFAKIIDVLVENSIRLSAVAARGRRQCLADVRHLGRRAAAGRVRALVDRADPAHRGGRARQGTGCEDHRLPPRRRCAVAGLCRGDRRQCGQHRLDCGAGLHSRTCAEQESPCRAISIRWC